MKREVSKINHDVLCLKAETGQVLSIGKTGKTPWFVSNPLQFYEYSITDIARGIFKHQDKKLKTDTNAKLFLHLVFAQAIL